MKSQFLPSIRDRAMEILEQNPHLCAREAILQAQTEIENWGEEQEFSSQRNSSGSEGTPVFVYGTLKSGHGNHRILRDGRAKFIGPGCTTFPWFRLFARGIPFLVPSMEKGVHVLGEVWEVDDRTLARMDMLEGHPHNYRRMEIDVRTDAGSFKCHSYLWLHSTSGMRDIGEEYT